MAEDSSRMTVIDLRQELKRRNLPQTGKKADLVDRLAAFEQEQTGSEPGDAPNDAPNNNHETRDSPSPEVATDQEKGTDQSLPSPAPAATALQPSTAEDAPESRAENPHLDDAARVDAEPSKSAQDSLPTQSPIVEDEIDKPADVEPVTVTEIVKDAVSRKRRSRSPPPENELSRKRARPSDEEDSSQPIDAAAPSADNLDERVAHPESSHQELPEVQPAPSSRSKANDHVEAEEAFPHDQEEQHNPTRDHDRRQSREIPPPNLEDRRPDMADEKMADYDREVAPSLHPATSALYIKNFMRPLRETMLRDYLIDLATFPGDEPDSDCLINFYLDQIRTHSLVRFTSVSAASRVRTALHGTVWPDERSRKELWVDFIPEDKVVEWVGREQSEGGRGTSSRWEVLYEPDENGDMTASLVNGEAEPVRRNTRQPLGPPPVPTGPARGSFPVVEGAPLGPRGRGGNHYRQGPAAPPHPSAGGDRGMQTTRAGPPIQYQPVPEELAQRRLANMRYYITKDRYRDLGAPDEINRYTFEHGDEFVDRGKEAFIGIRPPHRERERRRLGLGRGNPRGGRPPSPRRPRDDDYHYGGRDDYSRDRRDDRGYDRGFDRGYDRRDDRDFGRRDDVPRSRFDGQPLPTYGGPGPRGGRRGGGGRRY